MRYNKERIPQRLDAAFKKVISMINDCTDSVPNPPEPAFQIACTEFWAVADKGK